MCRESKLTEEEEDLFYAEEMYRMTTNDHALEHFPRKAELEALKKRLKAERKC